MSIDPLAGQMPFSSPYSYAANNPVVLVDVDGLAPGGGDEGGEEKRPKDKLNVMVTRPESDLKGGQYEGDKGDGAYNEWVSGKKAEARTNRKNARTLSKNPNYADSLTYFKVIEVQNSEDMVNQLEELMASGQFELGNLIITGHGGLAEPYAHIGSVCDPGDPGNCIKPKYVFDRIDITSFRDKHYQGLADRFAKIKGDNTMVFLHHCGIAGGENPRKSEEFLRGLSIGLGVPVLGSMGYNFQSSTMMQGDEYAQAPYFTIPDTLNYGDDMNGHLNYPLSDKGTGVWKVATPNGKVIKVGAPIFSPNGEAKFRSDPQNLASLIYDFYYDKENGFYF